MTEQEWMKCDDPKAMLQHLCRKKTDKPSERKMRLFACACCRRVWHFIQDAQSQKAVEMTEQFVDGLVRAKELTAAAREAADIYAEAEIELKESTGAWVEAGMPDASSSNLNVEIVTAREASWLAASSEKDYVLRVTDCCSNLMGMSAFARGQKKLKGQPFTKIQAISNSARSSEGKEQALLLRDIFGNPFRLVAIARNWRTPTVVSLTQAIYAERTFDRLPILADALEEAGCNNKEIFAHCRQPGVHVRGCWVVDLVLGKK